MITSRHGVFLFALTSLFASLSAHAQLTWDANGTGAGQTNGGGAWLGTNLWWNGSANLDWVPGSNAVFGGPNTAGGAVTLASPTTVGAITFNTFTGTYTLGTLLQPLTINGGMTNNSAAGAVSLTTSPIILGASQTWSSNSSGALVARSGVNNGGFTLTIDGSGSASFDTSTAGVIIEGSGGLTKMGSGRLVLGGSSAPVHTYAGTTTLSGGVTMVANNNIGPGNLVLNGGVIESYWASNFTRALGSANGQVQLTGGASGFGINGATGMSVIFGNNAAFEAVWGSAFFNPSALVLQASSAQVNASITFANKIDLNGANRTVAANGTSLGVTSTISGAIRNSSGTAAGLIKTGPGLLILTAANTYNGGTTISQGSLRFGGLTSMPAVGDVAVQTGTTLTIEVGSAGEWTNGTIGNGTIGGLLSGLGGQAGGTVSFAGDVTLGLETTGSLTYAGDIADVGTALAITKSGASALTFSGNSSYSGKTRVRGGTLSFNSITKVSSGSSALGAPSTVANGTIDVGFSATTSTLRYTGSGHSTDRVINLAGTTGGATLDASGTGAWTLTSAPTATVAGAKTLTLTGTSTAANALPATAIPGLPDVLTISKSGAGTWWVSGFSSPKNAWAITAGTLVASGTITTGDQQVTVSGGTLAGTGPIVLQSAKSLIVQPAGSLAPGNLAVGTMAVTGILDLAGMANGTGKLQYEIGAPNASDKIAVTGTAQIGSGLLGFNDFTFTDLGGMTAGTYVLLTTTGGITGTLDPANRSGTIGAISGTLQINGNNLEWTNDQDGDGLPDAYELANTTPPSATAMNPGDDLDSDGATNLQEFLLGTNPSNPDSDGDGLADGVETNTGIWINATNTGTKPLQADSDGDTIIDGYETNTGTFVSAANTGTNPNKPDSDGDGFRDSVETNTGIFVSLTNTGTNPNNADSDGDGAGDWYEVAIIDKNPALGGFPNTPNNASLKPNVPHPLPAPDASAGVANKPVKVYIMSGQSNMVGFGTVNGSGPGTLQTITGAEKKFPNLVASGGGWTTRQDVKYRGVISDTGNGLLSPVVSGTSYGPELGFGYVMGWSHDEPVLLIKASQGNRGLMWDILPPGSPRTVDGATTYPAYGESPETWSTATGGPTPFIWYAGKQYDDFFLKENDMGPTAWAAALSYPSGCQVRSNGTTYVSTSAHISTAATQPGLGASWATFWTLYSVFNTADILDNFAAEYPAWAAQGFEIAGFVWWQGYDDTGEPRATRYEPNMVQFIKQIRAYYENRYNNDASALTRTKVNAPFVLATLATNGGWGNPDPGHAKVAQAQLNVDGNARKANGDLRYPEFTGNVKTMEARGFWRDAANSPNNVGYHYNWNAETYLLVGDALGRAMVELETSTPPPSGFATWAGGPFSATLSDSTPSLDFDNGGFATGIEWVVGGDPTLGSDDASRAPTIDATTDPDGKTLFIFRRITAAKNDANTTITVEYGNLTGWTTAVHQGTAANQITISEQADGFGTGIDKVTVALPASLISGGKLFARLKVSITTL